MLSKVTLGGNKVDPSLLDNVGIPYNWSRYIYHVGSSLDLHSVIHSRLIAGGKDTRQGRQTVFFTAVNPVTGSQQDESYDVMKPRKVPYKTKWKVYQDAENWINLKSAQDKGSAFWQTHSNALILHDSCASRLS